MNTFLFIVKKEKESTEKRNLDCNKINILNSKVKTRWCLSFISEFKNFSIYHNNIFFIVRKIEKKLSK